MNPRLAIDAVTAIVAGLPDNSLTAARRAALEQLRIKDLPGTKDEDWKYTDLGSVIAISNEWLAGGASADDVTDETVELITARLDVDWLIIRNGRIDSKSISMLQRPGLRINLLSDEQQIPELNSPLSDMNIALLRDGLSISISDEYANERPLGFLHIDNAKTGVGVSHSRVVIKLGDNSRASFVEYHASSGNSAHYANNLCDLSLGNHARADYVRIQDRETGHSQTAHLQVALGAGSQFHHGAFDFGGALVRNDLHIQINGPDVLTSFCGLYLADGQQHIDNHTRVDHKVGPARSEQEYRGILSEQARCVWNGKAVVHAGADGTDANQANHNLLLSARSEVDAKPELEIYADDVKCSHGTTVGQLDKTALFYLRTRGIDDASARQLLTRAFAQKIVAIAPLESIHEFISDRVSSRLARLIEGAAE